MIEVPNFNGIPGLWHKIFDSPSYALHNIAAMQTSTFDAFRKMGYEVLFCDYVGALEVWGDSGAYRGSRRLVKFTTSLESQINNYSQKREKAGSPLQGRLFSPALIFVAKKPL